MRYTVQGNANAAKILFDKASQFTAESLRAGATADHAASRGVSALKDLLGLTVLEFDMNERGEITATLEKDS